MEPTAGPTVAPGLDRLTAVLQEDDITARWSPDQLIGPVERLVAAGRRAGPEGDASAAVALAVVAAAGPPSGWAAAWRQLLVRLRRHPSPLVAARSHRIHTAAELL